MQEIDERHSVLDFNGVRCTEGYICWIQDGKEKDVVPRPQVRRIALRFGSQVARPMVQSILGLALMAIIVVPLYDLWFVLTYGGIFLVNEAALGAFSFLGGWLFYDASRKGWYLDAEFDVGHRKLPFARQTNAMQLLSYLSQVRSKLGYTVEVPPDLSSTV